MKPTTGSVVEDGHGDTLAYATSLNKLRQVLDSADATISTTLPRGGLQVIQPRTTEQNRMRLYVRDQHRNDLVAWTAMARNQAVSLSQLASSGAGGLKKVARQFLEEFLRPSGLGQCAAAPLRAPVLEGYPGVLHVFRRPDQPDYSDPELQRLHEVAREFDEAITELRARRHAPDDPLPLVRQIPLRQMAVGQGRQILFPPGVLRGLDKALLDNLLELVETRLAIFEEQGGQAPGSRRGGGQATSLNGSNADRLLVPDERGEKWPFRLALFDRYPALSGGREMPVAVVSLQPECEMWGELRPSDFEADEEIARLIPALQYMLKNFTGDSNLEHIARTAHLSPFHFHRRFTELLGITPKHYLFDCQILEAKRKLAQGGVSLAEIASNTGFAHQSHFTSRFKQATGLTPTKWRQMAGNEAGTNGSSPPGGKRRRRDAGR